MEEAEVTFRNENRPKGVTGVEAYLLLRALGMDHVHVDAFVHQLVKELSCSLYGLNKHQHGGEETLKHSNKNSPSFNLSKFKNSIS